MPSGGVSAAGAVTNAHKDGNGMLDAVNTCVSGHCEIFQLHRTSPEQDDLIYKFLDVPGRGGHHLVRP